MKPAYWIVVAVALVFAFLVAMSLNAAYQPHTVTAVAAYPSDIQLIGNQCVGHYGNGVGVSWPSVNGTC